MEVYDRKIQDTEENLGNLVPNIDRLREGVRNLEDTLMGDVQRATQVRGGVCPNSPVLTLY